MNKLHALDSKIKVGSVSYLNAKPLIYGLQNTEIQKVIDFSIEYPSLLAQKLIEGKIDIGLVPVATIPLLPSAYIVSDYCIAAHKKVNSVCIYSHVPIEEMTHLYLDYQSRTSVRLAQILMENLWKKEVEYLPADFDFIDKIQGTRAGVIIGDRALFHLQNFEYVYDLSEYWYEMTGMDFVFAAWISNQPISQEFIQKFNKANQIGLDKIDEIVAENAINYYDLKRYYKEDILYHFDENKKRGLQGFLDYIQPGIQIKFL